MASPATNPEASEIRRRGRQRLIGAVTLVALLVVFVPMLLDSEPRPVRQQPSLAIPPKDNAPPLPTPAAAPKAPAAPVVAPKAQVPAAAVVEPTKPDATASVAAAPAASPAVSAPPAAAPKAADPRLVGFAVQVEDGGPVVGVVHAPLLDRTYCAARGVGAFRDETKLKQAREKLAAAGVVHYTERLDTKSGPLTRLRAGPFPSREAAEGALVSIKRGALDGKVVPLP